jgi:hypothetical protein
MSSKIKSSKLNSRTNRTSRTVKRRTSSNNKTLIKRGFHGIRAIGNIDLDNLIKSFDKER